MNFFFSSGLRAMLAVGHVSEISDTMHYHPSTSLQNNVKLAMKYDKRVDNLICDYSLEVAYARRPVGAACVSLNLTEFY
jgi:hypothetical protein